MSEKNVVLLVDNRKRDLPSAALISHQLQRLGIRCSLQPLEAYKAVLASHKPDMIIFNHLLASHLVNYSKRLQQLGVLTGVLPNEALMYNREELRFNAGRFHNEAHIDYYFCWHSELKNALLDSGFDQSVTRIDITGIPRFDYYFQPWSNLFGDLASRPAGKKRILLCTNFGLVRFSDLPKSAADKFFSAWAPRISFYHDYWGCIQSMRQRRDAMASYILALANTGHYEIILRPHPSEDIEFYQKWINSLDDSLRQSVQLDAKSNITKLILASDLTIAVEKCTTTLESWIAGKPTINLIFDQHPMLFDEEFAAMNVPCHSPQELPDLVARELAAPEQGDFTARRQAHLGQWCGPLDGNTCQRMALIIRDALDGKQPTDWSQLNLDDHRRAAKLHLKSFFDLSYTYDPVLAIKRHLFPKKYVVRTFTQNKTIRPEDVRTIMKQIGRIAPT